MEQKKIAILGGGIAGIILAKELSAEGRFKVDLLEKNNVLGGMLNGVKINNVYYDIGTFVYRGNHYLFEAFPFIKPYFMKINYETSVVTPSDTLTRFPISPKSYIRDYGVWSFIQGIWDLLICKFKYWNRNTLLGYIWRYIGRIFYERMGLKYYVKRFCHLPEEKIDILFGLTRLGSFRKNLSFRKKLVAFFRKKIKKEWYVRPKEGWRVVFEEVKENLETNGVRVRLGAEVGAIRVRGHGFEIESEKGVEEYDEVISTIPLNDLQACLNKDAAPEVQSQKMVSLFYRFGGSVNFSSPILFNYSKQGAWKRITVFSRLYGKDEGDDYFVVEVNPEGGPQHQDERGVIADTKKDFEAHAGKNNFLNGELKYQGGLVTACAYPVYSKENLRNVGRVKNVLEKSKIEVFGRQGNYDFFSSAKVAYQAKRFAYEFTKSHS